MWTTPGFLVCRIMLDSWQGFEYVSAIDYVIALVMLQYSYNNIIIVTN